jgi:hypothetical protein
MGKREREREREKEREEGSEYITTCREGRGGNSKTECGALDAASMRVTRRNTASMLLANTYPHQQS